MPRTTRDEGYTIKTTITAIEKITASRTKGRNGNSRYRVTTSGGTFLTRVDDIFNYEVDLKEVCSTLPAPALLTLEGPHVLRWKLLMK